MEPRKNIDWRETARATASVQKLIQISQTLLGIGERETQALLQNDMLSFGILQDEKESAIEQYTKASEEFRERLEEFKNVDRVLLGRLEALQKNLSEKTRNNNVLVLQVKDRSYSNTQKTLLMAQEYGQQKRARNGNTQTAIKTGGVE